MADPRQIARRWSPPPVLHCHHGDGWENLLDERCRYHGSGIYAPGTSATLSYEASL